MNNFINTIKELSHPNKYTKWYINICNNAKLRADNKKDANLLLGYIEKHHIVPDSFFINSKRNNKPGFLEGNPNDINNLVYLTAREHFVVHMLLPKMLIDKQLSCTISAAITKMMNNKGKYYNSRTYDTARKIYSKNHQMKLDSCREKFKITCNKIYGTDHPVQNKQVQKKSKTTCKINWNTEYPSQNTIIKQSMVNAFLENYGVDNPSKNTTVNLKRTETIKETYGEEYNYITDVPEIQEKMKINRILAMKEKYGVSHNSQIPEVRKQMNKSQKETWKNKPKIRCPFCGFESKSMSILSQYHFDYCYKNPNKLIKPDNRKTYICPHCNKESTNKSSMIQYHFDNCIKNINGPRYKHPKIKVKIKCPHCELESYSKANMIRYHFNNCKHKK